MNAICRWGPLALATLLGAGGGAFITAAHAGPSRETPYDLVQALARVLTTVEGYYVDPVERTKLLRGAVKGMVSELDAHSVYMTTEEGKDAQDESQGHFASVGVEVDLRGDAITVIAPIEGSPAERAGIKGGDRIVAIDDELVVAPSLEKTLKRMRGPAGTKVKLRIRRSGVAQPLTFDLIRDVVRVASVRSKPLAFGVGYLRIRQFQEGVHGELLRHTASLRAAAGGDLKGLILDLRANPGGLVDEAMDIADELLDEGGIYTTRHRGFVVDDVRARRGGALTKVPVVVLVNDWSASASELLAGALQDNNRALVVGSQTFGKGSVQAIVELPGIGGLKLTTARYYTPSGRAVQADGIHPDVLIASKLNDPESRFRERDYANHLPAEPSGNAGGSRSARAIVDAGVAPEDGGLEPAELGSIPTDPRGGPDYGLDVAFDVLTKQVMLRGARVR